MTGTPDVSQAKDKKRLPIHVMEKRAAEKKRFQGLKGFGAVLLLVFLMFILHRFGPTATKHLQPAALQDAFHQAVRSSSKVHHRCSFQPYFHRSDDITGSIHCRTPAGQRADDAQFEILSGRNWRHNPVHSGFLRGRAAALSGDHLRCFWGLSLGVRSASARWTSALFATCTAALNSHAARRRRRMGGWLMGVLTAPVAISVPFIVVRRCARLALCLHTSRMRPKTARVPRCPPPPRTADSGGRGYWERSDGRSSSES